MSRVTLCPNLDCGTPTRLAGDHLGRVFRCPRCRSRLPVAEVVDDSSGSSWTMRKLTPPIESPSGFDPGPPQFELDELREVAEPKLGYRFGRFQLMDLLGVGTFARVYRAYDQELRRDVVLKILHDSITADSRVRDRFEAEARTLAQLSHALIVTIHETGRVDDRRFLVMPFIEGKSLDRMLDNGPVPPLHAAKIVRDVATALAYAHDRGVVHRDVKPANILVSTDGTARLMDFGLAHSHTEISRLTSPGAILGTPAYLAPEQAAGKIDVHPAMDQYALGVVMYEALAGIPPFNGHPAVVLYKAMNEKPIKLTEHNPSIPRELESICQTALAKRPESRYESCLDMAHDLNQWIDGNSKDSNRPHWTRRIFRSARAS